MQPHPGLVLRLAGDGILDAPQGIGADGGGQVLRAVPRIGEVVQGWDSKAGVARRIAGVQTQDRRNRRAEPGRACIRGGDMGKRGSIAVLLACEVGAMGVWFASAVVAALIRGEAGAPGAAWLTAAVQAGFVLGTAGSAALSLADRFDPRRLFAASALTAAAATAALALLPPTGPVQVLLRLLTGMCMAGVYPVGMRLAATWARPGAKGDLGLLVGLLVAALTLGSASPHLLGALPGLDWREVYLASAALAAACGLGIGLCALGPNHARAARIDPRRVVQAWRSRPLRLANLGYLGHMWELYAMWAWLGPFLLSSFTAAGVAQPGARAEAATFAAIALGAAGAWGGGALADRVGRTRVTAGAMLASAACALLIGWLHGAAPALVAAVALAWGVAVIADSAQFSAAIAELADPASVGTLLTLQTCMGFALTLVSIGLVPVVVGWAGWPGAFTMLAAGPLLGAAAMTLLRGDPAAARLAGGRG